MANEVYLLRPDSSTNVFISRFFSYISSKRTIFVRRLLTLKKRKSVYGSYQRNPTLDDLTSGFNIGWNISTNPQFNGMLGFSEEEVCGMFRYYQEAGRLKGDVEAMIDEMKPWYDNFALPRNP